MSRRSLYILTFLLLVMSPALLFAQTTDVHMPTRDDIKRLQAASDGYVRIIVQSLSWKVPANSDCASVRSRIESMSRWTTVGVDEWVDAQMKIPSLPTQPTNTVTPDVLLGIYQRTEENTMTRHAMLSQQVYEAVRNDCLMIPNP